METVVEILPFGNHRWRYVVECLMDAERATIYSDNDHLAYTTKVDAEVAAKKLVEHPEWDADLRLEYHVDFWCWELRVSGLGFVVGQDYATQEEARRSALIWASRLGLRKRLETVV